MKQVLQSLLFFAILPVLAQEYGTNDFRISDAGGVGFSAADARDCDAAFNSATNQYLVVWEADDTDFTGVLDNENEIIGQFIDNNGNEVGVDFMISSHQGFGNNSVDAENPEIVYNNIDNNFLVVYRGDITSGIDEIYGVIVAADGTILKPSFRISNASDVNATFDAQDSDVVYNSIENEYLVVWRSGYLAINQQEILGQRLDNLGNEIGTDFRISNQNDLGIEFTAIQPKVAWNSIDNEYLVVFRGYQSSGELEIFGQLLDVDGFELGLDFRISDMGIDADPNFDAFIPDVEFNPSSNEYLVVWHGDDDSGVDQKYEVFGQRLDNTGTQIGVNDFRIGSRGNSADATFGAQDAEIIYQNNTGSYFVVFDGDNTVGGDDDIFIQEVASDGTLIGNEVVLTNSSPGSTTLDAFDPVIASNGNLGLLIAFEGDFSTGLLSSEDEVHIQMFGNPVLNIKSFELEDQLTLYPNPSNGKFNLIYNGLEELQYLTIMDLTGKHIKTNPLIDFDGQKEIDLNYFDSGIYLMFIKSNISEKVIKLIKN